MISSPGHRAPLADLPLLALLVPFALLALASLGASLGASPGLPPLPPVPRAPPLAPPGQRAATPPLALPPASAAPGTIAGGGAVRVRLAFVGDLSLSLVIARFLDRKERRPAGLPSLVGPLFPFDPVAPRLAAADLAVGNLECVLSDRGEAPAGRMPLRCALGSLGPLRAAGFDLVSVANNHAFDFGSGAFADMLRRLDQGGLAHVGAASYSDQPQAPACFDLGGASPRRVEPGAARAGGLIRVGVLAYNTPGRRALADVAAARGALDVLVVFPHWGAEDHAAPTPLQIARARELIDAGADLVVGTHAHVVQPTTWHRGKLVAYGLGNFVFPGMDDSEAHRTGALLEVEAERAAPGGPVALVAHRILRTRIDGVAGVPRLVGEPVELTAP